jgi:hypothetical protein
LRHRSSNVGRQTSDFGLRRRPRPSTSWGSEGWVGLRLSALSSVKISSEVRGPKSDVRRPILPTSWCWGRRRD